MKNPDVNSPDVTITKVEYITLQAERDTYRDLVWRMRDYFSKKTPNEFKAFTMLENVTLSERSKTLIGSKGRPS